ncbi:MAG TPA: hypothetical protein VHM67_13725 [Gemmatimonadaceae bacterium]|nr:hypothetical protein [Gemmatimonadaceae bacterium]
MRRTHGLTLGLSLALLVAGARGAQAQTAEQHLALGDSAHAAMNPAAALRHYEAGLAVDPRNYELLWKAARDAVDVGEHAESKETRTQMYRSAELYARRAVEVNPGDAEGHFHLARSLGRAALALGPRDRIKYATDVRAHALEALKLDPKHPGALHVMGMWNAEVMRLSGPTRWIAKNILGGKVFDSASWKEAVRYMQEAVANEPERIVHHADLAEIYRDTGDAARARAEWEAVLQLKATDFNDRFHKQTATDRLRGAK